MVGGISILITIKVGTEWAVQTISLHAYSLYSNKISMKVYSYIHIQVSSTHVP